MRFAYLKNIEADAFFVKKNKLSVVDLRSL